MSNSINVTFEPGSQKQTGHIVITHPLDSNGTRTKIETSKFYMPINDVISDAMTDISTNPDDTKFTVFQQKLRCVDIQKDAKIKPSVADYVGMNTPLSLIYTTTDTKQVSLDNWKDKFREKFETITKKETWTRLSKGSKLGTMLNNRIIFKETGLSPEDFIELNANGQIQYVGNIANEVIDPAGRSNIDTNKDIRFPTENVELKLTKDFFNFFGFKYIGSESVSLNSTYTKTGYKFTINIGNTKISNNTNPTYSDGKTIIVNTNKKNGNPTPIGWFPGNAIKNTYIKQSNISDDVKKAFFITKELGDVLQVLIMLIWSELNKSESYSMVTNDHVVFFLCMILQLNCILTPGTESKKEKGKVRIKLQTIHNFEPTGNTIKKAKERFIKAKELIYNDNLQFINSLIQLRTKNLKLYVSGIDTPFDVDVRVYTKFIDDLTKINDKLNKTQLKDYDETETDATKIMTTIMEIDQYTSIIKNNFTIIQFIKLYNSRVVIYRSNFLYTNNSTLWIGSVNPSIGNFKYNKTSLSELIQRPQLLDNSTQLGGGLSYQDNVNYELDLDERTKNKAIKIKDPKIITSKTSFTMKINTIVKNTKRITNRIVKRLRDMMLKNTPNKFLKIYGVEDIENLDNKEYLEFPDKAFYYDKIGKEYNLYEELEYQVKLFLGKTREKYFVEVYGLLLHYFYLTGNVLYDDELKHYIKNMFIENKAKTINYESPVETINPIRMDISPKSKTVKDVKLLNSKRKTLKRERSNKSPRSNESLNGISLMDNSSKSESPDSKRRKLSHIIPLFQRNNNS